MNESIEILTKNRFIFLLSNKHTFTEMHLSILESLLYYQLKLNKAGEDSFIVGEKAFLPAGGRKTDGKNR